MVMGVGQSDYRRKREINWSGDRDFGGMLIGALEEVVMMLMMLAMV